MAPDTFDAEHIRTGFIEPCLRRYEQRLLEASPAADYNATRGLLRQYLLLREVSHLEETGALESATKRYTKFCAGAGAELEPGHLARYLEQLMAKKLDVHLLDDGLIERVRRGLQGVSVVDRYYALFVASLEDELIDEAGDPVADNKVFPPVTALRLMADSPAMQQHVRSRKLAETGVAQQVDGAFTLKGHSGAVRLMESARAMLENEAWVVPLTDDDAPTKIRSNVAAVKARYEAAFVQEWVDFFADVEISRPLAQLPDGHPDRGREVEIALEILAVVGAKDRGPHLRLLGALETHTQLRTESPLESTDPVAREQNRHFLEKLARWTRGAVVEVDLRENPPGIRFPEAFKTCVALFKNRTPTAIEGYVDLIGKLRAKVAEASTKPRTPSDGPFSLRELDSDFTIAQRYGRALLRDTDERCQRMMLPLLVMPVDTSGRAVAEVGSGGAGSPTATPSVTP